VLQAGRSQVRFPIMSLELALSFRPRCAPEVDSVSNRNEYRGDLLDGKEGRCVGLANLPPSYAECIEIWETQRPQNLRSCSGLYRDCLTLTSNVSDSEICLYILSSSFNMDFVVLGYV